MPGLEAVCVQLRAYCYRTIICDDNSSSRVFEESAVLNECGVRDTLQATKLAIGDFKVDS